MSSASLCIKEVAEDIIGVSDRQLDTVYLWMQC
ncbi:hypothetical protein Deipe_0602 [Deinococcus peraridilitoris DSM 19664]|uniref:Uncharacterized protein n=1 Tax=Deinococcus peraridilitoris (strain DSM 19664 / LMG 22246 / CIP 109416 / KR-200) TaxID=937777 RepID=K9ZZ52_DEIPD|nr:hypothetical protein Deipe_0602 [Deinococcus peraridilitoris DSM 19664]